MPNYKNYKPRKSIKWFMDRIGKDIVKNNDLSLFNPTIYVSGKGAAKILHASQDKGHRYIEFVRA